MAQGRTHAVNKDPGKRSFHLSRQSACLFTGKAMPAQDQAQDTMPPEKKLRIGSPLFGQGDRAIRSMMNQTRRYELPHRFGDGRGIDMKFLGQIHGFHAPSPFQNASQIFTAPKGYLAPGKISHADRMCCRGSYVLPSTKFSPESSPDWFA
jgi:hypothetical protein